MPFAKIDDLTGNPGPFISHTQLRITAAALHETAVKEYPVGTILVSMYGTIGLTKTTTVAMAANQAIAALLPPFACDPNFLSQYLRRSRVLLERAALQTTQANISGRIVRAFPVKLPPEEEQHQIATILDTVDAAIRRTEQVIAKLELVKKGLLHDLLTRGVDENGELRDPERHPEQFKESELGWIPRSWKVRRLDEVASVERGTFTHRPRNDPTFYGGKIPFIQTGDVTAAQGRAITHFSQTLNERGALVSKEFPAGTIAITIAAHIAETAVLGLPMYFPDSVVGAVVNSPNSIRFTELCIRRAKATLDAKAPQSAQKNINLRDLRPLRIPHPSPEEQDRVSEVYDSLLRTLSQEVKTRDKLRLVKKGLMEDLLTGKVRVTPLLEKGEALASATVE